MSDKMVVRVKVIVYHSKLITLISCEIFLVEIVMFIAKLLYPSPTKSCICIPFLLGYQTFCAPTISPLIT